MMSLPSVCLLVAVLLGCATQCSTSRGLRQVISREEIQQLFGILPPPLQAPSPQGSTEPVSADSAASPSPSLQVVDDGTGQPSVLAPPNSVTGVLGHGTASQQAVGTSGPTASLHSPAWTLTGPPGVSSDPRSSGWEALFHSPSPSGAGMAASNPDSQGALQMGAASSPADMSSGGPTVQSADSTAVLPPDAAAASIRVLPSPSPLPFGDKDPYGDAAASRGGAMPAQYQPHQGTPGYSPEPYMPDQAAPTYISRLAVDIRGDAIAPAPSSYQPGSLPGQAFTDSSANVAAPSSSDIAAWLRGEQWAAPPPDQASQAGLSSIAAASPTDAAAPPPAPPPPTSQLDQASQGSPGPAQPPSVSSPDSQQAASAPNEDVSVQPFALPPVTASAQSDQQPLLKVYQDSADRWRKIAIAGIVLLALLFGALLACSLCHLAVTRQLEKPAAKLGKNGRYKGMQEFEMPEVKSSSWGMP